MLVLYDCAVPSGAPENLTAEAMSSTHMLVTWGPVPDPQQNGNILGYKVETEYVNLAICGQGVLPGRILERKKKILNAFRSLHESFLLSKSLTFMHDHTLPGPRIILYMMKWHARAESFSPLRRKPCAFAFLAIPHVPAVL